MKRDKPEVHVGVDVTIPYSAPPTQGVVHGVISGIPAGVEHDTVDVFIYGNAVVPSMSVRVPHKSYCQNPQKDRRGWWQRTYPGAK